jgi:hypothetical protein
MRVLRVSWARDRMRWASRMYGRRLWPARHTWSGTWMLTSAWVGQTSSDLKIM